MKRIYIIITIIVFLLAGAIFAIPKFFIQKLIDVTQASINKHINAEVEFEKLNLSLIRNFPKATLELENTVITGVGVFANDTLLDAPKITATTNLVSLFKNTPVEIEEIIMVEPDIHMLVEESGLANWEIFKEEGKKEDNNTLNDESEESGFNLELDNIKIENAEFIYLDQISDMTLDLQGINLRISGKMYGNTTSLKTFGDIENFSLNYGGVNYLSNLVLKANMALDIDYSTMQMEIKENELLVNRLPLTLTGEIKYPSDSMFFNVDVRTKSSDFESFLALIPPEYDDYLKDVKANGTATVTGEIKGMYFEDNYPSFRLKMDVTDGNLHYADLPEQIKKIGANVEIWKPQGEIDLMEIYVKKAHAEVRNSPVDLTLKMNHIFSDPWFDGALVGKVNLDHLKEALPLDSVNISGEVDANLFLKGNYSSIENKQFENLNSDGIVLLDNFVYDSPLLTQRIVVPAGRLEFSPKNVKLEQLNMNIGRSDFKLSGIVSDYLDYIIKKGKLKGSLQLNSNLVNLNELLLIQAETVSGENVTVNGIQEKESEKMTVFNVPDNIDISFRSDIKTAYLDRLPISNIRGLITLRDGTLILNGLNMGVLDGELNMTGSYRNSTQNRPFIDFGFDISEIDVPQTYHSLTGIQRMLPVAGHSKGRFSSSLKMRGQLSENLKLIPSTINGNGIFSTMDLQILNSPIFNQLKGILRADKLRNVAISDFKANFSIEDGNISLKPFNTNIAGQEARIEGKINVDNLIDMRLDFKVQRDAFGTDIQNILGVIPGNEKIEILPAGVLIKGPVGNPEVKMDLTDTRKTIADATKDDLKKSLNKLGKGLQKLFEK